VAVTIVASAGAWGLVPAPAHASEIRLDNQSDLTFDFVRRNVTGEGGRWQGDHSAQLKPSFGGEVGVADVDWSWSWGPTFSARYWAWLDGQDVALDLAVRFRLGEQQAETTCTLRFYSGVDVPDRRCEAQFLGPPGLFSPIEMVRFKVSATTSQAVAR
jgi:hypothetical protein